MLLECAYAGAVVLEVDISATPAKGADEDATQDITAQAMLASECESRANVPYVPELLKTIESLKAAYEPMASLPYGAPPSNLSQPSCLPAVANPSSDLMPAPPTSRETWPPSVQPINPLRSTRRIQ